jgi:hypothetical protein
MAEYSIVGLASLMDASAKSLLLAAIAAIALRLLSVRNVNLRHRVWTAVLLAMLVLPAIDRMGLSLPFLPTKLAWLSHTAVELPPHITRADRDSALMPASEDKSHVVAVTSNPTGIPRGTEAEGVRPDDHRDAASTAASPRWPVAFLSLYLAGVGLLLARLAAGFRCAARLANSATTIEPRLSRQVRVASSDSVRVPVTVGLLRPTILLPADWSQWGQPLLASVLAHEIAHVDRRDHLVLLTTELNRCLYWFHPLAWFLPHRLTALAEQCCDDMAIAALGDRRQYARHLLEMARRLASHPNRIAPLGMAMARTSIIESRINAILDVRRPLARQLGCPGMLVLLAVVIPVVVFVASLRAEETPASAVEKHPPTAVAEDATLHGADEEQKQGTPTPFVATLRGRVVLTSTGVTVPQADVRMLTYKANGYKTSATTTDAQGEFAFEKVPAGSHHIFALADDLASRHERYQGTRVDFDAKHPPTEPIVLKMSPAPSIKVGVTVKDGGAAVADANVKLIWTDIKGDYRTDREGNVVFRGLTPEVWHVEVHANGYAEQVQPVNLSSDQRVELVFALEPGGTVHGVVKSETGEPLADVGISVFPADYQGEQIEYVRSDAEGRYRFDFLPLDKPLQLDCSAAADYQDPRHRFTLDSKAKRGVDLDLVLRRRPDGGSVKGHVTDLSGKPIAGAKLTNPGRSSSLARTAMTDTEGRFALDNVFESGTGHQLIVKATGFAPEQVTFQPAPRSAPAEITIKLAPGHRIRGRVQNSSGRPIAEAHVFYAHGNHFPDGGVGGSATTDSEGRFSFDSLPVKPPFTFDAKGYSEIPETFLPLDGDDEVVVTMQPQGVLRGHVVDAATGKPIAAFNVRITFSLDRRPGDPNASLSGPRARNGERFVAADGQFRLDHLVVGMPLQVSVEAEQYGTVTERRVLAQVESDANVVEFKLPSLDPMALATVRGTIVDELGRPIGGAELRLIIAKDRPVPRDKFPFNWEMIRNGQVAHVDSVFQSPTTVSDNQGAFSFDKVRMDADVELAYWGEGVSEGRKEHLEKLTAAERENLRVVITTPGAVRGTISRVVLPKITSIAASGGNRIFTEWLDNKTGEAEYSIRNLPPGEYELQVYGERIPTGKDSGFTMKVIQRQPIRIESGKTLTADIGNGK